MKEDQKKIERKKRRNKDKESKEIESNNQKKLQSTTVKCNSD